MPLNLRDGTECEVQLPKLKEHDTDSAGQDALLFKLDCRGTCGERPNPNAPEQLRKLSASDGLPAVEDDVYK